MSIGMERASEELERRSRYLSSLILIQHHKKKKQQQQPEGEKRDHHHHHHHHPSNNKNKEDDEGRINQTEKEKEKEKEAEKEEVEEVIIINNNNNNNKSEKKNAMNAVNNNNNNNVRVRASDMTPELQKRAFHSARQALASMPKLDSKLLALTLKKEFDSSYGPAWHCIVGTSFGSYVTHSLGGFLYFSVDKVYILLFRTAVEPLHQ